MAYMTKDGKGPYPHKAGDYCGNHSPGAPLYAPWGCSHEDYVESQKVWLAKMRFGRPRPCKAGTTKERQRKGDVGLYLKADKPLFHGDEIEIPAPAELMEPPEDGE